MKTPEAIRFISQFLSKPHSTGAILPSSSRLAHEMVNWIDWGGVRTVIEYGPGTGAFTPAILESKRPDAKYCAIEINPLFVKLLKDKFPQASIHNESVGRVEHVCRQESVSEVDVVICGLPWANFSEGDQNAFFEAMFSVLKPGGCFATFAYVQGIYLPAGMRLKSILAKRFGSVKRSRIVWRNLPPAFVYRCVR